MGRRPKPWWRESRKAYFATVKGVCHRLGTSKRESQQELTRLFQQPEPEVIADSDSVAEILEDYLLWVHEHRALKTYVWYRDFCKSFDQMFPTLTVAELTTKKVNEWLKVQNWNSTTKRGAITAMIRVFNWAVKNRDLEKNPIKGMEKPEAQTRTSIVTPAEFDDILQHIPDEEFSDLLIVSYDSGARPPEVKNIEARHVELKKSRCVLPTEEAKGKKEPRVIYLPTERSLDIVRRRMAEHPTGPIFRNTRGRPWTAFAVKCRFEKLEAKLGKRYRHYDFRHGFITRKLLAGVDSHVVASLAGHSDSKMIDRVYSHVADDHEFMLKAAKQDINPEGV